MENLEKIVGYVFCAPLVAAASYAIGALLYHSFKKDDKEYKKEEYNQTKAPYLLNR